MPGSKYDRELRFIDSEMGRLNRELEDLRELMPSTPLDAEKKAVDVGIIEERLGELYQRKKEIEDSFIAAGLDPPSSSRSLNANTYATGAANEYVPPSVPDEGERVAVTRPAATREELSAEIASITDEMMKLEISMLQADLSDDVGAKQKASMEISAMRSRREQLVGQVKELNAKAEEPEVAAPADADALTKRIEAMEADNRALRSQVSGVRTDVAEMKDQLRQILEALNIDN